jgi:DNA primase catalytic subunit
MKKGTSQEASRKLTEASRTTLKTYIEVNRKSRRNEQISRHKWQNWTNNINHLNRSIRNNVIEAAIKNLLKSKSEESDGVIAEFYQTCTKQQISTLLKVFHEIEREGTWPNSFYVSGITLIAKPDKDTTKLNYRRIP